MIRRLLYHFFWNLYDYLGTYLLLGAIAAFGALGIPYVSALILAQFQKSSAGMGSTVPLFIELVTAILVVLFVVYCLAGMMGFATMAVHDEPARLPDYRRCARELFRPYLKETLAYGLIMLVMIGDLAFYLKYGGKLGGLVFAAGLIFLWIAIGAAVFLLPLAAAPARFPEEKRLLPLARKAFILFVVAPGYWFMTSLLMLVLLVACVISIVGVIFLMPIFAVLTTTALGIAVQHVDFLRAAREQLGDGKSIGEYKRKARELAWDWEEARPKRTFRELIKPWET